MLLLNDTVINNFGNFSNIRGMNKEVDSINFVKSMCSQFDNYTINLLWYIFLTFFIVMLIRNIVFFIENRYINTNNKLLFIDSSFKVWGYEFKWFWCSFEEFELWLYQWGLIMVMLMSAIILLHNGQFSIITNIIHYFI